MKWALEYRGDEGPVEVQCRRCGSKIWIQYRLEEALCEECAFEVAEGDGEI